MLQQICLQALRDVLPQVPKAQEVAQEHLQTIGAIEQYLTATHNEWWMETEALQGHLAAGLLAQVGCASTAMHWHLIRLEVSKAADASADLSSESNCKGQVGEKPALDVQDCRQSMRGCFLPHGVANPLLMASSEELLSALSNASTLPYPLPASLQICRAL